MPTFSQQSLLVRAIMIMLFSIASKSCRTVSVQAFSTTSSLSSSVRHRMQLWAGTKRNRTTKAGGPAGSSSTSSASDNTALTWETFEFGESPKWDDRFESSRTVVAANEEELQEIRHEEAVKDTEMAQKLNQELEGWHTLDAELVARATDLLRPYVRDERIQRIEQVLSERTKHVRFLFENPVNPSNVWACLRTLDAFGIQHVDVVLQSERYKGKAALAQKRGMRTAMGSAQWLSLRNYPSTSAAVEWLQGQGYQILASDLSDRSKDIRQLDWRALAEQGPICIVMGNEESGISDEMREKADATFFLPMAGFAESFNLSVATAIAAAHLSAASSTSWSPLSNKGESDRSQGPIRPGDLSEHEYNCLFLKGLINSVAQKRMAFALLKQEGIVLPPAIDFV